MGKLSDVHCHGDGKYAPPAFLPLLERRKGQADQDERRNDRDSGPDHLRLSGFLRTMRSDNDILVQLRDLGNLSLQQIILKAPEVIPFTLHTKSAYSR